MDNNLSQNPYTSQQPSVWATNPRLKTLLLVLIFVFLFSGMGLIILLQIQNQSRERLYEETEAGLPIHKPFRIPDGRLLVNSPKEGDEVGSTFTVSGYAENWFEGNIVIKIFDNAGHQLYMGTTIAPDNYQKPAPFLSEITLTAKPTTPDGHIEFDDYSAKDGSLTYQKIVKLQFANTKQSVLVPDTDSQRLGWKTFTGVTPYGPDTQFSIDFPDVWTVVDARGGKALQKDQCSIALGAGGHGLEGSIIVKTMNITAADGTQGTVQENDFGTSLDTFASFKDNYIFELTEPKDATDCFDDFLAIVKTVKIGSP